MLLTLLLLLPAADPPKTAKPDREKVIQGGRAVVAAVVRAAEENGRRGRPLAGDALTGLYVRAAVKAAGDLPQAEAMPALLLGLGVALDRSSLMRYNPLVGLTWRRVETNAERAARLAALGEPTLHGRHDLAQHFFVSCALTAVLGARAADSAGLTKELLDAQDGGSGFSFADLSADLAGVRLAARLLDRPSRARALAKGFRVADYALPPRGLVEGLTTKEFEKRYGGVADPRFKKERDAILRRIEALPGFQD
jgi:hypothetical protein